MPSLPTSGAFPEYYAEVLEFSQANVAASQSAVAMKLLGTGATNGTNDATAYPAWFAGRICGIQIINSADKGAGTLTVCPTIGGTAITAPTTLVNAAIAAAATPANLRVEYSNGKEFAAGDLLGCKITTDGSWDATTIDIVVRVFVIYKRVQP